MSRRTIWFTSDWHLGHQACLDRFAAKRPFKSLEEMHHTLIKKHNNVVKPDDIVYNLGDILFGTFKIMRDVVTQLNGTQILLLGNHDKGCNKFLDSGFDLVLQNAEIRIQGELVSLSHYPLVNIKRENTGTEECWHKETKYQHWALEDKGQFHLHGHIHCLSSDTEVLTYSGWKKYFEISDKDLVLTKNLSTGTDEWQDIKRIYTADYDGEMYNIDSAVFSQKITPNHRLLLKTDKGYIFNTPDKLTYTISKIPVVANPPNKGVPMCDSMLKLLIWITTDGSLEDTTSGIRFRFKKERKIHKLKKLLDSMGCPYSFIVRKDGVKVFRLSLTNEIVNLARSYFKKDKLLPEVLRHVNQKQASIILDTYAITDGCYSSENAVQISSSKKEEMDLLQQIFTTNNISCKIAKKKNKENCTIMYVNIKREVTTIHKQNNITKSLYVGTVWCLNVNNGNFLIRHNGCVSFTGNSPNKGRSEKILDRQFDVGVDANNYQPVSEGTIESWIVRSKRC